ncbi:THO complex subunit 7 [Caerostris extrusa]|uniref:THO complex subunit 7 n=1 Tax=Caerostris extrusa TaxID=172846 RepID=A0AAV4U030_CAEEX|nr:THO complex subunit 7 [Caerostris extrusa]
MFLKKIANAQDLILQKKEELKAARKIREQKLKYDALARIITQLPDRKETEIKLKLLNEEITALNDTNKQLESKIDTRHKELKVLLNSAAALEEHIKDEELQLEME